jgi:DNA-binding response OmpR family regulator
MDAWQRETGSREERRGHSPALHGGVVLLADGDVDMHMIYGALLECRGYAVVHAWTSGEVLRLASAVRLDAVLVSVGRRGLLTWDAFHELARAAAGSGIPIVCITTDPYAAEHAARMAPEAARVLMLPCTPVRLAAFLERAIRRPRPPVN